MNDNETAAQVLRDLAEAIIRYKCRGERDFQPVNEALLRADAVLCPALPAE
jgi:hypothetical protein